MATIYFAKVNYDNMYEIYHEERTLQQICKKVFSLLNTETIYKKIEMKKTDTGEEVEKQKEFEFFNLERYDNDIIIGNLIKKDYLYLKKLNKETEEVELRKEENDESILFFYDTQNEVIAFHKNQRFGHLEFIQGFEGLLNSIFAKEEEKFTVGLYNNNISIDRIFDDLKRIGKIKELTIEVIPPNVNSEELEEIKKEQDRVLKQLDEANVTRKTTLYKSNTEKGINIENSMILDNINEFRYLNKNWSEVDILNRTYGEITATSISGQKYTSKNSKPLKYEIEDENKNRRGFLTYMKDIIANIIPR